MRDESISQSEIDALVRGMMGGHDQTPAAIPPAPPQGDSNEFAATMREFITNAAQALSELVGIPCQGELVEVSTMTLSQAGTLVVGEVLAGRSHLTSGLTGKIYYLVPSLLGLEMITQLYGGIAPSTLDDSAMGALADGLTQMNQSGLSRFADLLGRPVLAGPVEGQMVNSFTEIAQGSADHPMIVTALDLTVGDKTGRVHLIFGQQEVCYPLLQAIKVRQMATAAASPRQHEAMRSAPGEAPQADSVRQVAAAATAQAPVGYRAAQFPDLAPRGAREDVRNLDLLLDVSLQVTVELGRTRRQIRDVLSLGPGSVLELDKLAGEQVDVLVNGKLIAKGEVVVIDENYGVRITDIITPAERVQSLK